MEKTVQAIYEDGALRPMGPLLLEQRQQVTVTITDATVFVTADQRLCRVAALEGFSVTNPEQPASLTI